MGKHTPRRAQIVFTEVAEQQLQRLDAAAFARLERVLDVVAVNPMVGPLMERTPTLREYSEDGCRIVYFATTLGTVVVVAYVEA